MELDGLGLHLTYCTNIHPGSGWDQVLANLRRYAPELRSRLAPGRRFGLGLRLSALEARQLREPGRLDELRRFLDANGLYVALINGFVFGSFHGQTVKAAAFAPDWRDPDRVAYTLDLLEVLAALLPEDVDGGISTLPVSYKAWVPAGDTGAGAAFARNLARVAEAMARVRSERGRHIHLDIEPEPGGLVEDSGELADFFRTCLLPEGVPRLARGLGVRPGRAEELLLDHVRVCLDTCHLAVEYESPVAAWKRLQDAGLRVGRLQVSSALEVPLPAAEEARLQVGRQLEAFADGTYLHQVIEEAGGARRHFPDLPQALETIASPGGRRWRVHFHVPLFVDRYQRFVSTQADTREFLRLLASAGATSHLEIETYTWEVLPPDLKEDLVESICREYRWVLEAVGAAVPSP